MEKYDQKIFWDQLLQLIAENKVIPIIGGDLLVVRYKNEDVLLYALIAKKLAEYLEISTEGIKDGDGINEVVSKHIERNRKIQEIYPALKYIMSDLEDLSIPNSLIKLARIIHFKLFVTTTFDSLLERAINKERFNNEKKTKIFSYSPNYFNDINLPIDQMNTTSVYHIFGKVSATPVYVVTQEDTLEFIHHLQSENQKPPILFDELNKNNLLFLGCGYDDWLARFFIRTQKIKRLLDPDGGTDYIVDNKMSSDKNLALFLRNFSSRTKIYDGGGAIEFIDELYQRWSERFPAISITEQSEYLNISFPFDFKTGTVFLSYASEDIDAATRIKNALNNAGVEVFFDKEALYSGDNFEMKIIRSIKECALFIVVISKHTLTRKRRNYRIEWDFAIKEAIKAAPSVRFILPVVIDGTRSEEPNLPFKFREIQWESAPEGYIKAEFISLVKKEYREYQKR